jgi:hypothetical protein
MLQAAKETYVKQQRETERTRRWSENFISVGSCWREKEGGKVSDFDGGLKRCSKTLD